MSDGPPAQPPPAPPRPPAGGRLLATITCPNCWRQFPPEQLLFVARHSDLLGDDVLGPEAYRRFPPTRFTISGNALDARGMECQELACPRCHLTISRPLVELSPCFVSMIGAPASGKSYFLAASTWRMRRDAGRFHLAYASGDPVANEQLQRYEQALFLSYAPDTPVEIRKTETHGSQLYQRIVLDGHSQALPQPFVFTIQPGASHPRAEDVDFPRHSVVFYDNAGEHFLPGQDNPDTPVTWHLARSAALLFVFDPTQDPRFRSRCRSDDPQLAHGLRPDTDTPLVRQELVLNELDARIRRYRGLTQTQRHDAPLLIVLAKADIWHDLIDLDLEREPFTDSPQPALDLPRIEAVSARCRDLMLDLCPEIVTAAESLSQQVRYIPVSALGRSPELVEDGGRRFYGIRPRDIEPRWATVPLLWTLAHTAPGLLPVQRAADASSSASSP